MKFTKKELINSRFIHYNVKSGNKVNCLKIHGQNTFEHELMKFIIAYDIVANGGKFFSEAIFKTKGRADIVDITEGRIIEVLHSEDNSEFLEKSQYYPADLELDSVSTKDLLHYLEKYLQFELEY